MWVRLLYERKKGRCRVLSHSRIRKSSIDEEGRGNCLLDLGRGMRNRLRIRLARLPVIVSGVLERGDGETYIHTDDFSFFGSSEVASGDKVDDKHDGVSDTESPSKTGDDPCNLLGKLNPVSVPTSQYSIKDFC